MEKPTRLKAKSKLANKAKSKKRPTCSMFLAELTRKLALGKKFEEEAPINVVESIVDSIARALPVKLIKPVQIKETPPTIETLQAYAPELKAKDVEPSQHKLVDKDDQLAKIEVPVSKPVHKAPKFPIFNSGIFSTEQAECIQQLVDTKDASVNTITKVDVAGEITKHVGTLKKISLIAEEFNQKTAKNLREIVDSVQEDLMKKLEEIKAEESLAYDIITDIA